MEGPQGVARSKCWSLMTRDTWMFWGPPSPQGALGGVGPGWATRPKVQAPARPRECRPAGGSRRARPHRCPGLGSPCPLGLERDQMRPSESGQGERGGRPKDVRWLLSLRPEAGVPSGPLKAPPKVRKNGGPAQPKAKRAPRGPADQRARKPKRLPGPSGDPRGHIQRWLAPGVAAEQMGQDGGPASKGEHARHAPLRSSPLADCGMGSQPGPGSVPGVPGSSTDPPRDSPPQSPGRCPG